MATLVIPDIDATLQTRLQVRARAHHRSIEDEARETLRAATARDAGTETAGNLMEISRRIFGPQRGLTEDLPLERGGPERPPPDFSDSAYDR